MSRETKYYELGNGVPAYREDGGFPTLITRHGERVIYNLQELAHGATPISKAQFDRLVEMIKMPAVAPN